MNKIESIQKRALQLLYNDFERNFSQFLDKARKSTITVVRLLCLLLLFQIIRFKETSTKTKRFNLKIIRPNHVRYGERSLRVLGQKIWNNLPAHVNLASNRLSFKRLIKSWDGLSCKFTLCKKL